MFRNSLRLWAVAILLVLVAAQAHAWVEVHAPGTPDHHACQLCVTGGVAIVSASASLELALRAFPLEVKLAQPRSKNRQTEATAPRAPPRA